MRIPEDWKPWVELAKDEVAMNEKLAALIEIDEELAKLAAVCMSAAKWINGREGAERCASLCGCCLHDSLLNGFCDQCVLRAAELDVPRGVSCVKAGRTGRIMKLYAKMLTPKLERRWRAVCEEG